jgi:hypothetical protein
MDDSKIKELQQIHKDLAAYLKAQREVINNNELAISAIRQALDRDPTFQTAYKASLRDLIDGGTVQPKDSPDSILPKLLQELMEW